MGYAYTIIAKEVPSNLLHRGFFKGYRGVPDTTDVFIGLSGKAALKQKSAVWLEDEALATAFLAFYEPVLQQRWPDAQLLVERVNTNKWIEGWLVTSTHEVLDLLNSGNTPIGKARSTNKSAALWILEWPTGEGPSYFAGKTQKGAIRITTSKQDAKRYVRKQTAQSQAENLPVIKSASVSLISITDLEANELDAKRKQSNEILYE